MGRCTSRSLPHARFGRDGSPPHDLNPSPRSNRPPRPAQRRLPRSTSPRADSDKLQVGASNPAGTAVVALFSSPSPAEARHKGERVSVGRSSAMDRGMSSTRIRMEIRMPDSPSSRERRLWVWALVVVTAIYSTADLARMLADALRESGVLELTSDMFNVGMLLVGPMILVHLSPTRSTFPRARTGGLRMEKDDLARILKRNQDIDRTAIES